MGSNGADSLSRLHNAFIHFFNINLEEIVELVVSDSIETVFHVFFVLFVVDFDPLVINFKLFCFFVKMVLNVGKGLLEEFTFKTNNKSFGLDFGNMIG